MTNPHRALLVSPSYFGLATLSPGNTDAPTVESGTGSMQILSWSEAPDGRTLPRRTETIPAGAVAARHPAMDAALSPYTFGFHSYDPFQSLSASLDRAAEQGAGLSLAVWAAMEADLFRFAFDQGFTTALELARGTDEWRRFAALNSLYRSCVMALAPFGVVPPYWNAWLRGDSPGRRPLGRPGAVLERLLTRRIEALTPAVLHPAGPDCFLVALSRPRVE